MVSKFFPKFWFTKKSFKDLYPRPSVMISSREVSDLFDCLVFMHDHGLSDVSVELDNCHVLIFKDGDEVK